MLKVIIVYLESNLTKCCNAGCRSYLVSYGAWGTCMDRVKKLLGVLAGPVRAACERGAAVGAHGRAQRALAQLHLGVKRFVHTDTLMLPTLGKSYILTPFKLKLNTGMLFIPMKSFYNYLCTFQVHKKARSKTSV